ncbi:MAG: carboxypeptidase regulatory-like domain-containing protein [Gemmatimonadaceae bacterium]
MLLSAQQVTGRVVTPEGFGIVGVEVQVLPSGPRATTDSGGRFVLWPVDTGTHLVRARRIGFSPSETTIRMRKGSQSIVITLQANAALLDTVRSQALEFALPRAFDRRAHGIGSMELGRDLIAKFPKGFSLPEMISLDFNLMRQARATYGCPQKILVDDDSADVGMLALIKPEDVAAVETFNSLDFVHEPTVDAHRGPPGMHSWKECTHLVLVWLKGYEQPRWAGR